MRGGERRGREAETMVSSHCVALDILELTEIYIPLPPECWD